MRSHVGVPIGGPMEEYLVKPTFDEDGVQVASGIGLDGKEHPDSLPMAVPVGYDSPPDLMTMIRTMIRSEHFINDVSMNGYETFEEADDFDVADEDLPPWEVRTDYEKVFDPVPEVPKTVVPEVKAAEPAPAQPTGGPPASAEKKE